MWLKLMLVAVFGFTSSLTTSFDLRGVINGDRMAGAPLGISLGEGEVDVEGICTRAGMACQNCSVAVTCVRLPFGWLKVPLERCSEGLTCNAHLGKCSSAPVPECDNSTGKYRHYCEQVGIFPDAHDCRKFHLCSPPQGLPDGRPAEHGVALCPRNYGYNPQTAQCSIELPYGQCQTKPVPECTIVGESGVLPLSQNHYYVCLLKGGRLHPQVFLCPHGWQFRDGYCREPTVQDTNTVEFQKPVPETQENTPKSTTEVTATAIATEKPIKPTTTKIESFFSTEKATTFAADTFLADKFDLANYETTDVDNSNSNNDFVNSFESREW